MHVKVYFNADSIIRKSDKRLFSLSPHHASLYVSPHQHNTPLLLLQSNLSSWIGPQQIDASKMNEMEYLKYVGFVL